MQCELRAQLQHDPALEKSLLAAGGDGLRDLGYLDDSGGSDALKCVRHLFLLVLSSAVV